MEREDRLYQFGPFCLDAGERVLLRDGRLVPLPAKALSTLLVLLRNMGHVVEKNVLMTEVWPQEDVEEGNLAQHIFMLRRALGESSKYIETVPRRGYRFLEPTSGVHRSSKRHTENAKAYQAYLKARYCWSEHTRNGLEQAVGYFRQALDLDPNYALAYAGIVDCYLRLATNYLPPTGALSKSAAAMRPRETDEMLPETQASVEIRCEFDREIAEREYKRATELECDYPGVHQWHTAYRFSLDLCNKTLMKTEGGRGPVTNDAPSLASYMKLSSQLKSASLTLAEEVQIFCLIAREQRKTHNYDAGCAVLERWWTIGEWPKLDALSPHSAADLLFTAGALAGGLASTTQLPGGQKHAEALLNGALGIFEQLGLRTVAVEARIELATCYFREELFDLSRLTLLAVLEALSEEERDLRSVTLIWLAAVESSSGRLDNSLARLNEAAEIVDLAGPMTIGYYHLELAMTHKMRNEYLNHAIDHYCKALRHFEGVGSHRFAAVMENNSGCLLLQLGRHDEAEVHLVRARKLFDGVVDKVLQAQVDETLSQLYLATGRLELAEQAIVRSVDTLELGRREVLLAESLTTQGRILCRLGRRRDAKRVLERAYAVAERCGDREGAARGLLTEVEEMCDQLEDDELLELGSRLDQLLADSQQTLTLDRLRKCHELIASAGFPASSVA